MEHRIPTDLPIPPRPALIDALMKERSKEEPNFHLIEKLITSDVGVSGTLMKIANSPVMGARSKITTIRGALQALGMKQVISLSCGLVMRFMMKGGDTASMERFWDTTDHVSALCGVLARRLRFNAPDEAQSYGLFHDCGIPVLMMRYPTYKDVLRAANAQKERSFIEVEDEILRTNHAVVGSFLARSWGLSDGLVAAILNHHDLDYFVTATGDNGVTKSLMAIGHMAEHLHHMSKRGSADVEWEKFAPHVLAHFGLLQEDYDDLAYELEQLANA